MARFPVNTHRQDPYRNFKFIVKWDGEPIADVSRISGLGRTTEAIAHRDGGHVSSPRVAPGVTGFPPLVLDRALTHDTAFEDWAKLAWNNQGDQAMSLKDYRKDIQIEIRNLQGQTALAFTVFRCWVSEYHPFLVLDANDSAMVIERLVIQHEGWDRDLAVSEPTET